MNDTRKRSIPQRALGKARHILKRITNTPRYIHDRIEGIRRGTFCTVCGRKSVPKTTQIISDHLASTWELTPQWRAWYDDREGTHCPLCRNSRRTQYMASSLLRFANERLGTSCTSVKELAGNPAFHQWSVAEFNACGQMHRWLARHPDLAYSEYKAEPPVREENLLDLTYPDASFDLILTSETLEHVPDVPRVLSEIRRVLKPGGTHLFTIPVVWDREQSRIRARLTEQGEVESLLPPSYHGCAGEEAGDMIVFTEFGADAAAQFEKAGFKVSVDRDDENPSLCTFITTRVD